MTEKRHYSSYGEEIVQRLKLRTHPVALKMLEKEADIPDGAVRPKKDLGYQLDLCQAFCTSRHEGLTIAMLKGDNWCYSPVVAMGIVKPPKFYLEGHMFYPEFTRTLEAAKRLAETTPRLEHGKFVGVVTAPLETANFEPDIIVIYGNSAQLRNLLSAFKYQEGEQVTSVLEPGGACIRATIPSLLGRICYVTVPCLGDRRWAMAKEDEMIFTVPVEKLESIVLGLRHLDEAGYGFPIKYGPRPNHPQTDKYIKVGRMIGLDMGE